MNKRDKTEITERAKLRVLAFLNDPVIVADGGAVKDQISRAVDDAATASGITDYISIINLLPKMKEAGLIDRVQQPSSHDGNSKPYFITDVGKQYLQSAQDKAMSTETGQRQDWATGEANPGVQETVADFIRRLPEFQTRSEERIQRVSRELSEKLAASRLPSRQNN